MKVVFIQATKGGVGKTTLSLHLGIHAKHQGLNVAFMDTNYPQGSLTKVLYQRESQDPLLNPEPRKLTETLRKAKREGIDLVVIDGTPDKVFTFQEYAPHCDILLSPIKTSLPEREAAVDAVDAIPFALRKRQFFVLNQVRSRRNGIENFRTLATIEFLESEKFSVCPVTIGDYVDFEDAFEYGLTVTEYNPEGKAASEIAVLWDWLVNKEKIK